MASVTPTASTPLPTPSNFWLGVLAQAGKHAQTEPAPPSFQVRLQILFALAGFVKLVNALVSAIGMTIVIPYIWNTQRSVQYRQDLRMTGAWRVFVAIPMLLHIFLLSFGQVQAYLVRGDSIVGAADRSKRDVLPSAKVSNSAFLAIGLLLGCGMLATALALSIYGVRIQDAFRDLQEEVLQLNVIWNGQYNEVAFGLIRPEIEAMMHAGLRYNSFFLAFYAMASFTTFVLMAINIGAIVLTRLVRGRARHYIASFNEAKTVPLPTSSTRPVLMHMASFTTSISGHSDLDVNVDQHDISQLSPKALRLLAERASHGMRGQQAKKMLVLLKAERELVVTALWLAVVSMAACGLSLWYTISLAAMNAWTDGFSTQEAALLALSWVYTCILLLGQPILLRNSFKTLFKRKRASRQRPHSTHAIVHDPPALSAYLLKLVPSKRPADGDKPSMRVHPFLNTEFGKAPVAHLPAPSSMVRVLIEESQIEEYRTDDLYEGVETRIEGGVFYFNRHSDLEARVDGDLGTEGGPRRSSATSAKSDASQGLLKPPPVVVHGSRTEGFRRGPRPSLDLGGASPLRQAQWARPTWANPSSSPSSPASIAPPAYTGDGGLAPHLEVTDFSTYEIGRESPGLFDSRRASTLGGPIVTTSFSEAVPVEWLLGPPSTENTPQPKRKGSRS
ncbi:hypothetical protein OIO90_003166 [Microbotryomycetes sp. JL221]|nr:hypothetical protein OIO90_003166 [Microbotryomycetes sp. JL221]